MNKSNSEAAQLPEQKITRDYWRRPDVLNYLNVGRESLSRWIKNNGFPKGFTVGGRYQYWRKQDVIDWVELQRTKAA